MADTRGKALSILKSIFEDKAYSDIALDAALKKSVMDGRDKAFVTNIVYGVLTNLTFLDYQIKKYSKLPFEKLSLHVVNILRLTIYQLHFMDRVPSSAAVNEGVALTKRTALKAAGFVNAVLRTFLRGGPVLPEDAADNSFLAVKYSYPQWIISLWMERFGRHECEELLSAGNAIPPVTIRVNETKISPAKLIEMIDAEPGPIPGALYLTGKGHVGEMKGFKEGFFTVQDAASQKAVLVLDPQKNDRVLDMCAAPGGKTTHISERLAGTGAVVAWDKYAQKIGLIEKAARRLGLSNITAYAHDAGTPDCNLFESFDKVLLDAPCSGLGIIRKKPDIKWLRMESDADELCREQSRLLSAAALYVKPGGRLVYSTCTLNKAENEEMISIFLLRHSNFSQEGEPINLYPHKDGTDGFFICAMRRCE